ncbi:helix-turn-helix domain-containing protein [Ancylomarina sp.]|uniref:helix-turn-helix domain-containing protein n=1 Tax=Ancylomarina sp. TaxID=1970196 RepID=UPI00356501C7
MAHITQSQRYTICCMLNQGYKQSKIALAIGKNKSVVSRECKRNSDGRSGVYKHDLAQRKYLIRQKKKAKRIRFNAQI